MTEREREDHITVPLGTSALKEGAVIVVGTAERKNIPSHKMTRTESSEEKER
jgi:hypothetical protein